MNKIKYAEIKQKSNHNPLELVNALGFHETLHLAQDMLHNEEWDDVLQEYGTSLLEALRKKYPDKWNSSWKYDALLGYAYHIILKYDERYAAYKRAAGKIDPTPPELLIALARCCIAPDKPPITEEEAILLIKEAIKNTLYVEGVELLKGLYKSTGNIKEQQYWENIFENIKETGSHLTPLDRLTH